MDIKPHVLKYIKSNGSFSLDDCRQEMFEVWLQNDPSASWEKLVDALDTMEYHHLAQSVKTKYAAAYNAQMGHGTYVKLLILCSIC